jgi:hypothetical protein
VRANATHFASAPLFPCAAVLLPHQHSAVAARPNAWAAAALQRCRPSSSGAGSSSTGTSSSSSSRPPLLGDDSGGDSSGSGGKRLKNSRAATAGAAAASAKHQLAAWRERITLASMAKFARQYGPVAGVVHSSVYLTTLCSLYLLLDCGVDLVGLL